MKRFLVLVLASGFTFGASAQSIDAQADVQSRMSGDASVQSAKQNRSDTELDAHCVRETGSHLPQASARDREGRMSKCNGLPGSSYSHDDLERTGATSTADALRKLDPSIH